MTIPLFDKLVSAFGGAYADASFVATVSADTQSHADVQTALTNFGDLIQTLINASTVTGRGFQRRNDNTLTINNLNLADFVDVNTIYAAGIDKTVTWTLPTDADIAATAAVNYPVVMEFTHIGGSARIPGSGGNRVNLDIAAGDSTRISTSTGLVNLQGIDLLQGDVVVITKEAAGQDWFAARSLHDPSTRILPSGTWEFHGTNSQINNIANVATELNNVVINAGDVFIVETGADYWGEVIANNSLVVALIDSPGLVTTNGDDWYIINDGDSVLTNDQIAFFNQVVRSGTRFDLSRNVFVNESNVRSFVSVATGTPLSNSILVTNDGSGPTARTLTYSNQALQFAALQGGTLSLTIQFAANSLSGFPPELTNIELVYGSTTFTFPLGNVDISSGSAIVDITLANNDYTSILNTNCTIRLNMNMRGVAFDGTFTIQGAVNTLDGSLRPAIQQLVNNAVAASELRVQNQLDEVRQDVSGEDATFAGIQDRISPYRTEQVTNPEPGARFLNSSGSDAFPAVSAMSAVLPANPRFTVTGTAVFVAVPIASSRSFGLNNVTQSSTTSLQNGVTNVTLGASATFQGTTYFIYRVTGLTANDIVEVDQITTHQVVAWQEDIDELEREVDELKDTEIDLPDAVRNVLENDVTVTEQTTPSLVSSAFNNSLGSGSAQKIYPETSPQSPSSGSLQSDPFSDTSSGARARSKLVYIGADHTYGNAVILNSFDGVSTNHELVRYDNGELKAQVFVPAQSSSTTTTTTYPAPPTRVSGAGVWQTIETLTFQNGIPVPESDELFFTRNIPGQSTPLTIQYRGHANGNIFGAASTTLANVGGSAEVATTVTISDGSETATLEIRYYPNRNGQRQIRASVTERVNTGLPTINDIQVILSWQESRTIPATAATVRGVTIEEHASSGLSNVIGIKEVGGNVVIVGDQHEVDINRAWTDVFGSTEAGNLIVFSEDAVFYDYQNLTITNTTITSLESHSNQPNFGLFDTNYTQSSTVNLQTSLSVQRLNVASIPTSATGLSSGDVWNDGGSLRIVT